ncbi:MAG: hypothetical protein R2729_00670 [Bryobacteraceae bacterium]
MQHFRVKLYAAAEAGYEAGGAIPVFHRWIQNGTLGELLIDVADYRHVPAGPGIVLVGYDGIYGLDETGHRLGLLYTRRTALEGTVAERIAQAYDAAVRAARSLAGEPEFAGKVRFDEQRWELSVNDRLLAPNDDASWGALEPAVRAFVEARFGAGKCRWVRAGERRDLLTAAISPLQQEISPLQ